MTKDFHPGCSFDKGRHPRPRGGERLTLNLEDETPNLNQEKCELGNPIERFRRRDSKSKSGGCELANPAERDQTNEH